MSDYVAMALGSAVWLGFAAHAWIDAVRVKRDRLALVASHDRIEAMVKNYHEENARIDRMLREHACCLKKEESR